MNNFFLNIANKKIIDKGFSTIELMLAISITMIISTLVLSNYGQFNSKIALESLAFKTALIIRQAQSYSLFVRSDGGDFTKGYGVHFNKDNKNFFILFIDMNGNERYESGEDKQTFLLQKQVMIQKFCGVLSNGSEDCSPLLEDLDVSFLRPDPEAYIRGSTGKKYQTAKIYLVSPNGSVKTIYTEITGQIYVQ